MKLKTEEMENENYSAFEIHLLDTKNYLAKGLSSVVTFIEYTTESVDSVTRLTLVRANSAAKHSFNPITTALMFGLLVDVSDTHSIASSTAFQAELIS